MVRRGKLTYPTNIRSERVCPYDVERVPLVRANSAPARLGRRFTLPSSDRVLQRANLLAGIFHAALVVGVFGAVFVDANGAPYTVFVDRIWSTDVTFYPGAMNTTCEGREYTKLDPWLECLSAGFKEFKEEFTAENGEDIPLYQPKLNRLFSIPMWSLLATFSAVTSFMHIMLATRWRSTYEYFLARKMQPFRWLEYSFTSAVMMLCIAALSRISEAWLLGFLFVANVYLNLTGGLVTELVAFYASKEASALLIGSRFLNNLWYLLYACSWLTFALTWGVIFDAYFAVISPYLDLPETGHLWAELFDRVTVVNFMLFALYFLFPEIHALVVLKILSFREGELLYIVSSFVAKGALVGGLMIPAVMRDD